MKIDLNSPPNCVLDDYTFNAFQVVPRRDEGEADSLDVDCRISRHKEDAERYLIRIYVDYSGKAKKPFALKISANGYFHWRGGLDSKEGSGYMAWVNGGTILYGLVRATVADLTSSCECGRVILPTIMIHEIVKDMIKKAIERTEAANPEGDDPQKNPASPSADS